MRKPTVSSTSWAKEKKEQQLIKLTPEIHRDQYSHYVDKLTQGIHNKQIKNIGLLGGYGSGKSSIILQLQNDLGERVKLVSFLTILNDQQTSSDSVENDKQTKESPTKNEKDTKNIIQTEIFKQLYYSIRPEKITGSKYFRIGKSLSKFKCIFLASLLIAIILSVVVDVPAIIKILDNLTNSARIIIILACLILLALTIASISYLIKALSTFFYRHPVGKIGTSDISLDLSDNTPDFDQMIDEIINIFKNASFDVVVFEDLDRFKEPKILEELRQLNFLLNESQDIGKKITFIYAVNDGSISGINNRVKIFDAIIPVVPFMATNNKADFIVEEFGRIGIDLSHSDQVVSVLEKWCHDMRELRFIEELYQDYFGIVGNNIKNIDAVNKILGIAVLRAHYPNEVASIDQNSQLLSLLDESSAVWNSKHKEIKDNIDLAEKIADGYTIIDAFIDEMNRVYGKSTTRPVFVWKNTTHVDPYTELKKINILDEIQNNNQVLVIKQTAPSIASINIDRKYINSSENEIVYKFSRNIGKSLQDYKKESDSFHKVDKFSFVQDVVRSHEISKAERNTEDTDDSIFNDRNFTNLIVDLVGAGMLGEDYMLYASKMKNIKESPEEIAFRQNYFKPRRTQFNQNLSVNDIDSIVSKLTKTDYDNPALYNYQIIDQLAIKYPESFKNIIDYSYRNIDVAMNFLDSYCNENSKKISDTFGETIDGSLLDKGVYFRNGIDNIDEPILLYIASMAKEYPKETITRLLNNLELHRNPDKETYFIAALSGLGNDVHITFEEDRKELFSTLLQNYFEASIINGLTDKICSLMIDNKYYITDVNMIKDEPEILAKLAETKNFVLRPNNIPFFTDEQLIGMALSKKLSLEELNALITCSTVNPNVIIRIIDNLESITDNSGLYNLSCEWLKCHKKYISSERIITLSIHSDENLAIELLSFSKLDNREFINTLNNMAGQMSEIKNMPNKRPRFPNNKSYEAIIKRLEKLGVITSYKPKGNFMIIYISKDVKEIMATIVQ